MIFSTKIWLVMGLVAFGASQAANAPALTSDQNECESLVGRQLGGASISDAKLIAKGVELTSKYGGSAIIDKPMCRVQGAVKPTSDSDIRFEVWLPVKADWNHYIQAIGGGGNAGMYWLAGMKHALDAGYAVSAQENGHVGNYDDASFAIGHPEKVIDFGWRSLHVVAVASKAVVAAYYGQRHDLALFNGCSTGGRQALVLAQKFPADYDGISAGAPANDWPALNAISAKFGRFLIENPDSWVSPEKMLMVQNAVQKHCGGIDGVIDDPAACTFDVATLACTSESQTECLTSGEVAGLKARFADLTDDSGKLLYPSFTLGLETSLGRTWMGTSKESRWYSAGAARMPEGFFREYVKQRPDWKISEFEWKSDLAAAENGVIGKAVAAENPDLSAFAKRGGKLIQWHGWHDMSIPARNSVRYYDSVVEGMGADRVHTFYRLFMGTGVDHCAGGPGPDSIGSFFGTLRDPDHDVMAALIRWIKSKQAPEQIIATKYSSIGAIVAQRPWCAYPHVAKWDGKGSRNQAQSYQCPAAK